MDIDQRALLESRLAARYSASNPTGIAARPYA
jgi:hypothetical protein